MPWPWTYGDHARALDCAARIPSQGGGRRFPVRRSAARRHASRSGRGNSAATRKRACRSISKAASICRLARTRCARRSRPPACRSSIRRSSIYHGVARQYPINGPLLRTKTREPTDLSIRSRCRSSRTSIGAICARQPLNGKMELVWGTKTAPINDKWMRVKRWRRQAAALQQRDRVLRAHLSRVLRHERRAGALPLHRRYSRSQSLMQGADDEDVTNLATNRVIFYGGVAARRAGQVLHAGERLACRMSSCTPWRWTI